MLVSCDSCEARYDYPDNKLRGRGAKFRCSRCGATVVVFPDANVAIAADHEPTTEDWTEDALPGATDPFPTPRTHSRGGSVTSLEVNPIGTVPPVQRGAVPFRGLDDGFPPNFTPTLAESTLSVTPPPPRAIRQPHVPVAAFVNDQGHTVPPPMIDETVRFGPPPRAGTGIQTMTGSPSPGRFTHGGTPIRDAAPQPVAYSPPTIPPPYASYGSSTTASGAPNRANTGPTDGGPPPRVTYGAPPQQAGHTEPGFSYGAPTPFPPPWARQPYGTGQPAPTAQPPPGASYGAGMTTPPWASYGYPVWTQSTDPRQFGPATYGGNGHTIPPYNFDPTTGVPLRHTHPGAPPAYTQPGADARGPIPNAPYNPMDPSQQGQPGWGPQQWGPPAPRAGVDRPALFPLLVAVLVVGALGACMGVATGRGLDRAANAIADQARAPQPSRVMIEQPSRTGDVPVQNQPSPTFRVETR